MVNGFRFNLTLSIETIEGNLNLKGRIYLGPIAIPGLIMVLGKDFKKTKSLAEKI